MYCARLEQVNKRWCACNSFQVNDRHSAAAIASKAQGFGKQLCSRLLLCPCSRALWPPCLARPWLASRWSVRSHGNSSFSAKVCYLPKPARACWWARIRFFLVATLFQRTEHAELSLYVMPSTLVRVALGERANASGPSVKALFALPELDLPFESSRDCIATWKLKHLVNKYDELRGKPMSQISAKALDYIVNAFSDPRVGKRKLDVFQLLDQFVLPLVWNVTTDEMLLRQQAATAMPIVSTRTISEAGRVHLEAFSEDELNTSFWAAGK